MPGSVLGGASATWQWADNGALVTEWWLTVGTSPGASDIHTSGSLAAVTREHTVSGLPTAGETVFVRLMYQEGGVWLFRDVQYTASTDSAPAPTPPPPSPSPPPPTGSPDPGSTSVSTSRVSTSSGDGGGARSAPDLSFWGLMAMVFGIWNVLGIDARRRRATRR